MGGCWHFVRSFPWLWSVPVHARPLCGKADTFHTNTKGAFTSGAVHNLQHWGTDISLTLNHQKKKKKKAPLSYHRDIYPFKTMFNPPLRGVTSSLSALLTRIRPSPPHISSLFGHPLSSTATTFCAQGASGDRRWGTSSRVWGWEGDSNKTRVNVTQSGKELTKKKQNWSVGQQVRSTDACWTPFKTLSGLVVSFQSSWRGHLCAAPYCQTPFTMFIKNK